MRRLPLSVLSLVVAAGCTSGDDLTSPPPGAPSAAASVGAVGPVVMTRNLYLGADIDPVIGAATPQQIPLLAAQAWAQVQANDFRRRAGALAAGIAAAAPHLVGLQEVATFRVQSPGDAVIGGDMPATLIAFDHLQLLLDSLAARGADYRVVAHVTGNDIEVPVFTGTGFDDVRFTQAETILARGDVATFNPQGALYAARINGSIGGAGGPALSLVRAWASIDATVDAHTFRFFSTHLEVQRFAPIQALQATELLAITAASPLPVVLVGDFNSDADGTQTDTYGRLVAAGLRDLWLPRGSDGHTCCHAKDLANTQPTLDQRIDYVFVRGFSGIESNGVGAQVRLVGARPADRTAAGWPSDHAGIVAALRLPPGLLQVAP